jgi:nucleoside-diphosphate-sugar epimerase
MASVLTLSDKYDEVIPPVVKGAAGIMAAAIKEPKIKSFVYTSSSTAALMPQPDTRIVIRKDTWDEAVLETVRSQDKPSPFDLYGASKTEAEKAIWNAVKEHKPSFQVATVLP